MPEEGVVDFIEAADGEEGESTKIPTVEINAYTGGAMTPQFFYTPVVIDLAGAQTTGETIPILADHDHGRLIGHGTPEVKAKSIRVSGSISAMGVSEDADKMVALSKNGFPIKASIGAKINKREYVEAGQSVIVNGRKFQGPIIVARGITIREVSLVAIGADAGASATIAASQMKGTEMDKDFEKWLEARVSDVHALSEEGLEAMQAQYDAEQDDDAPPDGDPPANVNAWGGDGGSETGDLEATAELRESRAIRAAEHRRVASIETAAESYPDIVATAIEEGWSVDKTELEVLRKSRPGGPAIHAADRGISSDILEAALLMNSKSMSDESLQASYGEKTLELASSPRWRHAGLQTLLRQSIIAAGKTAPEPGDGRGLVRAANEVIFLEAAAGGGGFSTVSVSGILGNVANKLLLDAFIAVPRACDKIAHHTSMADFKVHTRYRLSAMGEFEEVGADGELKSEEFQEDSYTNQLKTYGRMFNITRQMIINDDLDAFASVPQLIGRQSAHKVEAVAFTLLLSNPSSFFHADNANLATGGGSALDIDGLTAAQQLFLDQTGKDGHPILVEPGVLLVPTSLKVTAQNLMVSEHIVSGATGKTMRTNPHRSAYEIVSTPYLNAQGISGSSAVAWYLFARPSAGLGAAIEIGTLRGQRMPTIESEQYPASSEYLGVAFRGYYDFGVAMGDHRLAVKSAGT